ncbi:DsbE family thiol:disulfide interchange protein [Arenibaculum sp.]|uniref:DsbE family thiol:disulfide interchange protein n=1 Tax=Arenibaculum sp. TaxID=2865862 RepID=UPI002E103001|nr:DsbE family thiol:disulfide interchange protein [Arenibaculum sp.]
MKRLVFLAPLALFLVVAVYFAVGLTRDPRAIPSALIDRPVPDFSLPSIEGAEGGLETADLKGEVQLVNVWASWCIPCRVEHPVLMRIAAEGGVPIHGINYKDKAADATAYLKEHGNPYAGLGADRDGRVGIEWGVYGVPETYVVDREGRIRYRHVGPIMPQDLETTILPILRELKG